MRLSLEDFLYRDNLLFLEIKIVYREFFQLKRIKKRFSKSEKCKEDDEDRKFLDIISMYPDLQEEIYRQLGITFEELKEKKRAHIDFNDPSVLEKLKEKYGTEKIKLGFAIIDDNPNEWGRAACFLALNKQYEDALEKCEIALELESRVNEKLKFQLLMGEIYKEMGRFQEAIESVEEAISWDPKYIRGWINLGRLYEEVKNYEKGEIAYKKAIELNPKDPQLYCFLGDLYDKQPEMKLESLEAYQQSVSIDPNFGDGWFNLAGIYHDIKRFDLAEKACLKSLTVPSNYHDEALLNLATLYRVNNRIKDAKKYYLEAAKSGKSHIQTRALYSLGSMSVDSGHLDEGKAALRKVIEIDKTFSGAWFQLGFAYILKGNFEEASKCFDETLKLNPTNSRAWSYKGAIAERMIDPKAQEFYHRALQYDPENLQALNNLGNILQKHEQYHEAEQLFQKAIGIEPSYIFPWGNLIMLYMKQGKDDKVEESYDNALKLNKYDSNFMNDLAKFLDASGAKTLADKIVKLSNYSMILALMLEKMKVDFPHKKIDPSTGKFLEDDFIDEMKKGFLG